MTGRTLVALSDDFRFDAVSDALTAITRGRMVIVVDDEDRENEGDLVMAAEFATAEAIAFVVRYTSGFLCVAMPAERADELGLPPMVPSSDNDEAQRTAFAVSADAKEGVGTGISAADRAHTARLLAAPHATAADLVRPGHVLPLRARAGGVLERAGHTEATVDLCRLAGVTPVGVLCELVDDDGSMARRPALFEFARKHELPIITVRQIAQYRQRVEHGISAVATARLPTRFGMFTAHAYRGRDNEHLALVLGDPAGAPAPLVRVHSECLTGDVLGSLRCDCGTQLEDGLRAIAAEGNGVLIYLQGHEGRGIGLAAKVAAYALQERGYDTVDANLALGLPADGRDYGDAAAILYDLGVQRVRLLTNNPAKTAALNGAGIEIIEQVPLPATVTSDNIAYLQTKNERMGHRIERLEIIHSTRAASTR